MTSQVTPPGLLRGWGITIGRYLGVGFLGFVWTVAIARSLSTSEAGIVLLIGTLPALLVPVVDLGLPIGASYLVAANRYSTMQIQQWVIWAAYRFMFAGSLLSAIAIGLLVVLEADPKLIQIAFGLLSVPFAVPIALFAAIARGTRDFSRHATLVIAPYVLLTGTSLAVVVAGLSSVEWFTALIVLAHLIPTAAIFYRSQAEPLNKETRSSISRSAWRYGWRLYVSEASSAVRSRVDLVIVTLMVGTAATAIYGTAAVIGTYLAIVSQAAHLVVFPFVAEENSSGILEVNTTGFLARVSMLFTLGAGALIVVAGPRTFGLIFGREFEASWLVFALYLPGTLFLSVARIVTADLMGRGHVGPIMKISLSTTSLGVVLLVVGSAFWGVVGTAVATSVTAIANTVWRLWVLGGITHVRFHHFLKPDKGDLKAIRSALGRRARLG